MLPISKAKLCTRRRATATSARFSRANAPRVDTDLAIFVLTKIFVSHRISCNSVTHNIFQRAMLLSGAQDGKRKKKSKMVKKSREQQLRVVEKRGGNFWLVFCSIAAIAVVAVRVLVLE